MVRSLAPRKLKNMDAPVLAPLWSAALSFSKCHAVRKVPYDPNLHYIFDGEEYSRMVRFWTKGYDVYSPSRVIVGHDYNDANIGKDDTLKDIGTGSWKANGQTPEYRWTMFDHAVKRVKSMLGQDLAATDGSLSWSRDAKTLSELTRYGLGTRRTLDQYIEFSGIDPKAGCVLGDRCKGLKWVPHTTIARKASLLDPALDEGDPWGMSGEPAHAGGSNIPLVVSSTGTLDLELYSGPSLEDDTGGVKTEARGGLHVEASTNAGNLWWIFAPVDWAMTSLVQRIEFKRPGQGIRLTKILLLGVPLMFAVLLAGMWALASDSEQETTSLRDSPLPRTHSRSPDKMV